SGPFPPRLAQAAAGFEAGLDGPGSRHRLFAGFSQLDDFFFWEPFGAEIPVRHRFFTAGVNGTFAGARQGVHYRAGLTRHDTPLRPNRDTLALGFRQDRLDAAVEARLGGPALAGALGGGIAYYLTGAPMPLRDPSL